MAPTRKPQTQSRGLLLIAVFKILKGLALLAVAFGALHLVHRDLAAELMHWVDLLRIDPHNHYLLWILERLSRVDERKLRQLSVGTFFYAALFLCEGAGLALRQRWAEYLTIVSTASLMPIEIFETYKHLSAPKVGLLFANLAIVVYLVRELRRSRRTT